MRPEIIAATILAGLVVLAGPSHAGVRASMPVRIGGAGQEDACTSLVEVVGVGPRGFLAVRNGPGTRFRTLDRLHRGRSLAVCEERGRWLGVVYGGRDMDCAVSTPRPRRIAYTGPCSSGWVHRRHVKLVAG